MITALISVCLGQQLEIKELRERLDAPDDKGNYTVSSYM